jgi:phosphoglycerate kinase
MKLKDLPLKEKPVLVRVDFNVPLNGAGEITDDTRIQAVLPTLNYLLSQKAKVILMSHMGRPKGEKKEKYSLKPCAKRLSEFLGMEVTMAPDCVGEKVETLVSRMHSGSVLLLENLRFCPAEEKPELDPEFAKQLAKLADFYVNDAFGAAHRAHSSITEVPKYFPQKRAAGFLLEKEIEFLGKHFKAPKHPFYAIIGGAKVSSKLGVLQSLLEKADALFIGGGMAYTFLKAQGIEIGNSLFEADKLSEAKKFLETAENKKTPIFLPKDLVIANTFSNDAEKKVIQIPKGIPAGWEGMDIGPLTQESWAQTLKNAQMVFWNGPVGVFELPNFAKGTNAIARALAELSAVTIVGGGDSLAAVNQAGLGKKFTHLSTGGGASLEYIEFGQLPGIQALS